MSLRKGGQVIAGTPNITTGHHVGEIFWTSRLDNELNGAVDADGTVYSVEAFTGEQSVPELLRKGSLPFVSMSEYEFIVSTNGSCRAFGWDKGDTFRVPTVKALLLTKEQAAVVGNGMTLGLTNGTYNVGMQGYSSNPVLFNGAIDQYGDPVGQAYVGPTAVSGSIGVTTDPEKSGIVANLDVIEYRAMVQLSTGVKEDASQLKEYKFNNPHFFGESKWTDVEPKNGSWLVSNGAYHSGRTYGDYYKWLTDIKSGIKTVEGVSVKSVDDECTDYDFVINTTDETFRLPLKTKLASGSAVVGNGMTLGLQGGNSGTATFGLGTSSGGLNAYGTMYGTNVGTDDSTATASTTGRTMGITTDPDKSGIETSSNGLKLYFYVGDTLQDPALINAGGVLSDVAELKGHAIVETYRNGTEWYRIYADGWCEQGGVVANTGANHVATITLLKPYADTNYIVTIGHENAASARGVADVGQIGVKTTSNFQSYQYNDVIINWKACGQGA